MTGSQSDNGVCNACNARLNSYKGSGSKLGGYSIEDQVMHIIDASETELRPMEITRKIHKTCKPSAGQGSTVRVICKRLLERGLVIQPYPGSYCNKITYGVRFVPLMLHFRKNTEGFV